jgi:hypothetical protein
MWEFVRSTQRGQAQVEQGFCPAPLVAVLLTPLLYGAEPSQFTDTSPAAIAACGVASRLLLLLLLQ